MTSTLMGSGSAAFSPADSARALVIGLRQANRRLARVGWPVIERLTLVELYADRAVDAWYGLNVLTQSAPGDFHLAPTIETGTGPLRRPLATAYRGTDADLLSTLAIAIEHSSRDARVAEGELFSEAVSGAAPAFCMARRIPSINLGAAPPRARSFGIPTST